jgi:hypothetical protein
MEDINMPVAAKKVFDEALSLPAEARVSLVERLLASLNLPTQPEIDRLWAEEGEIKLIPGNKVFSNIRKKYRR